MNNVKYYETYHKDDLLPCFGDFRIFEDCDLYNKCWSNLGWSYESPSGIDYNSSLSKTYLAGCENFCV
jgi:hypothetical protein